MATTQEWTAGLMGRCTKRGWAQGLVGLGLVCATAGSAIFVKEFRASVHPLAAVEYLSVTPVSGVVQGTEEEVKAVLATPEVVEADDAEDSVVSPEDAELAAYAADPSVRWFNGRPIRPAKTMTMTVTGYSPDSRSCGDSADGLTATLHSVTTNAMKLVAADTRVLPYGSMVSIPGYDSGQIVPVLDCGGAIKGRKLDLMFPTHEEARQWGRKTLKVTIWAYADGKPADNPRKLR